MSKGQEEPREEFEEKVEALGEHGGPHSSWITFSLDRGDFKAAEEVVMSKLVKVDQRLVLARLDEVVEAIEEAGEDPGEVPTDEQPSADQVEFARLSNLLQVMIQERRGMGEDESNSIAPDDGGDTDLWLERENLIEIWEDLGRQCRRMCGGGSAISVMIHGG